MVDGHIIKLDFFATIRAMASETIVNISSIHTLETVSYPHANISRAADSPSCRGNLCGYEGSSLYVKARTKEERKAKGCDYYLQEQDLFCSDFPNAPEFP